MNNFKLGQYVQYKDQPWLIVKVDGLWLYLNNGTDRRKISYRNAKLLNIEPAKKAQVDGSKYLVTTKGNIFSVATGKLMQWPENHGTRVRIRNYYQ